MIESLTLTSISASRKKTEIKWLSQRKWLTMHDHTVDCPLLWLWLNSACNLPSERKRPAAKILIVIYQLCHVILWKLIQLIIWRAVSALPTRADAETLAWNMKKIWSDLVLTAIYVIPVSRAFGFCRWKCWVRQLNKKTGATMAPWVPCIRFHSTQL